MPRIVLCCGALCIFMPAARAAGPTPAGTSITVTLASGRQFRGEVDSRTTGSQLWLRCGSPNAYILRPIAWSQLLRAEAGPKSWSPADFQRAVFADIPPADKAPAENEALSPAASATADHHPAERPHPADVPAPAAPIRAVDVRAELGHWSTGTEADGLLVYVTPRDAAGDPASADGTLDLNLLGQRFVPLLADANQFPELAHWSQAVSAGDFAGGTAVYRLPFQALHPDFNVDLGSLGLVHARLIVPGQGVFEATTGPTVIRQINPVRNRRQQQLGQRFWPDERTDRAKTTPPAYFWAQPGTY